MGGGGERHVKDDADRVPDGHTDPDGRHTEVRLPRRRRRYVTIYRVPTQVLQSLIKSYIYFSICKALQSLIFGVFLYKRDYKVLFLKEKKVSESEIWFLSESKITSIDN